MDLSVIIVSFNVINYLRQCLRSLKEASKNIDCEIFVIDNNSSDNSSIMVINEFPEVVLIQNRVNYGFSAANNQAISIAKGRYILLLNPDTLIGPDALAKCIEFMDSRVDAGAVGVRMVDGNGRFLPESKRSVPSPFSAFFKSFGLSDIFPESKFFNGYYLSQVSSYETSRAEILSGAYMFIRKEVLNKTGPMDEDYFLYGEDIDLSFRILRAGYNNYYFPEVQITHFKGKSTSRNGFDDIFHFYRSMRIYLRKHMAEGKIPRCIVMTTIYLREGLAITYRFLKLSLRRKR